MRLALGMMAGQLKRARQGKAVKHTTPHDVADRIASVTPLKANFAHAPGDYNEKEFEL